MNERQLLLQKIKAADQNSKKLAEKFSGIVQYNAGESAAAIREYIGEKFLTEEPPLDAINIYELGRLSFLKLQKMKDAGVLGDEINTGCSGASTEVARKALFFMALQRDIGIKFLPEEIEQAETVGDIIGLSLKHLPKT